MNAVRTLATAVVMTLALGSSALAVATPSASHLESGRTAKGHNATFGAAPSSAKGPDGRPYYNFNTTPGGRATDHIAITNYTYRSEKLAVYTVDAVSAANGTISFPPQSAPRTQAGAWMAVGTPHGRPQIVVKPRSIVLLPVHVRVPMNASPGDHIGAVIVSLTGKVAGRLGNGSRQKVDFEQRIAVRAAFRVSGPVHANLTIEQLKASYHGKLDPFAKGYAQVTYVAHNSGNVVLGGPQTISVHGLFGEHVVALHTPPIPPLLPGASYPISVKVPRVYPEGLMTAKVTITEQGLSGDINPGLHVVSSSVHFLAIPWLLVLVLLLLILGLTLGYWKRRRGRASQPADLPTTP